MPKQEDELIELRAQSAAAEALAGVLAEILVRTLRGLLGNASAQFPSDDLIALLREETAKLEAEVHGHVSPDELDHYQTAFRHALHGLSLKYERKFSIK